jgi:hypothetical protein
MQRPNSSSSALFLKVQCPQFQTNPERVKQMRRFLVFSTVVCSMCVLISAAQEQDAPNRAGVVHTAAVFVAGLHDSMLDPASFVVDNVYVSAPQKLYESRGIRGRGRVVGSYVNVCVLVRSHNRMGGYTSEEDDLVADKNHPELYVVNSPDAQIGVASFGGFGNPCKHMGADITPDVVAAAEALYKKTR